jgi:hypothetical protein
MRILGRFKTRGSTASVTIRVRDLAQLFKLPGPIAIPGS